MYYAHPPNPAIDPVWNKSDPEFNERLAYPWPDTLNTPEACVNAIDWVIANIVDLYDDPIVEKQDEYKQWYEFVWGKTWSIRRQIVQMHLDDLEAVGIMERCARFHIFCAHAFVDFPEGYFAPKLNLEHIANILVGLKYLYSELNKRGIHCANEAEFMCYYLIHFPDSYRDVSEFPETVRNSKPLEFAREFFSALTTNNFVAFFNLVKKGTYLQACLMHRYFLSIREKAFYIMWKSHRRRTLLPAKISMQVINSLLAFEDDQECEDYLRWLGVKHVHPDVIFDKDTFHKGSIYKPIPRRSQIIERLRQNRYLSDIINGGEGRLVSPELGLFFSKPKLPDFMKRDEAIEKLSIKFRVAERIWQSLVMNVINNKVIEVFNKLKYPFGEPDYAECYQPSEASIISELNGTLNESGAEIVFDVKEDETTRIREEQYARGLLPKALQSDNSDKESVSSRTESLQSSLREQEPIPETEQAQSIESTSVKKSESEAIPKAETTIQKPKCLLKFVKPRIGINFGMARREILEGPELSTSTQPECEPVRSQELKSDCPPENSSINEPETGPVITQPLKHETSILKEVAKGLDDSDLIVSDDETVMKSKQVKSKPNKVIRATAASVLRAIARINEKRGP